MAEEEQDNLAMYDEGFTLATATCPQHIVNEIERRVRGQVVAIDACKSAQQQVWIVSVNQQANEWKDYLLAGRNRLVVRLWKGGCQWWNLNQNFPPSNLAQTELLGYQYAREALKERGVTVPGVVFSQIPSKDWNPWAILEYVGPDSIYLDSTILDSTWIETMVSVRHEFGFDEPHPRWGRVPESQALEYATLVLDQVIIPLHLGSRGIDAIRIMESEKNSSLSTSNSFGCCYTYGSMITLCQQAYQKITKRLAAAHYHHELDICPEDYQRWNCAMALLQDAVYDILPLNNSMIQVLQSPLPSMVLVHMDLQPQNLLFSRQANCDVTHSSFDVSSVLDWEDAAIADPRFELLLLGRKVCANREQAEQVWKQYTDKTNGDIGPLKPWLQLEMTHSILTMLLQSMDLLNGGRKPWETMKDLWGKLEREMARWRAMLMEDGDTISLLQRDVDESSNGSNMRETVEDEAHLAALGIHPDKCYRPLA